MKRRVAACIAAIAALLMHGQSAQEQTIHFATGRAATGSSSRSGTITPLASTNSITIALSPASATINLVSGAISAPSSPVAITTTWSLLSLTSIHVYGYFTTPTQALTGQANGLYIPASRVLASVPTGGGSATSYAPFTGTNTINATSGSLLLITQSNLLGSLLGGTRTDSMTLEVDLTGTGSTYNADTYSGTLVIQAQTF